MVSCKHLSAYTYSLTECFIDQIFSPSSHQSPCPHFLHSLEENEQKSHLPWNIFWLYAPFSENARNQGQIQRSYIIQSCLETGPRFLTQPHPWRNALSQGVFYFKSWARVWNGPLVRRHFEASHESSTWARWLKRVCKLTLHCLWFPELNSNQHRVKEAINTHQLVSSKQKSDWLIIIWFYVWFMIICVCVCMCA
jgi:hypothetical protein